MSPRASDHPALSLARWPAADQLLWEVAHRIPDFLEAGGHGATWRPASQRSAARAYGRWLGWLRAQGVDLDAEAPASRFTLERIRAYVAFLQQGRASVTVASYVGVLCMVMRALLPDADWGWLRAVQRRLRQRSVPVRHKQQRLVPANDLRQLGLDLIERAGRVLDAPCTAATPPRLRIAAARDYRDGLLIALLASRPLRVGNLLGIEIGEHLRRSGDRTTLSFKAQETKQKRALHTVWPEDLAPALTRYLAEVRPMLIAAPAGENVARNARALGARLWVGQGGTPLSPAGLQKALQRHTTRRFGHIVNAHLFRDCLATTLANEDPNHVRYAAPLLGHTTLRTTERGYIAADSRVALGRHHDHLTAMRKAARKQQRAARKNAP